MPEPAPGALQITCAVIAGREIPAAQLVCPLCGVLDLATACDTSREPWLATCPRGHHWELEP